MRLPRSARHFAATGGFVAGLVKRAAAWACTLVVYLPASSISAEVADAPDFVQDVQPILARHCLQCHGPDLQESGLRFDLRDAAMRGGDSGTAIAKGRAAESLLIERITAENADERMPPDADPLPPKEIEILRRWIDAGAPWPDEAAGGNDPRLRHWSFQLPVHPELPAVRDESWVRTPIDRFVLARLDRENLRPSPEADRLTLVRRVYLDLIGLPPTPEEADAFVRDPHPNAYERLVDRLLASPHYGERWARRWLDLARYADTNGYEKDRPRSIWPYRDWVIAALNADMPFDEFTVEQLAGDMLPEASLAQRIATGFHRNTMINEEGGVDVEEFRYHSVVDRANTTGSVWLGLTIGCAQCHTHKFDPVTQREYYRFLAFFNNADEPELPLPDPEIQQRRAQLNRQIAAIRQQMRAKLPELQSSFESWRTAKQAAAHHWHVCPPREMHSKNRATMTALDDGSVLVGGDIPNMDLYVVEIETALPRVTGLRLEVLPHESLPNEGPGRSVFDSGAGAKGDFLLSEFGVRRRAPEGDDWESLALTNPTHSHALAKRSAAQTLDGNYDTGWSVGKRTGEPHHIVYPLAKPVEQAGTAPLRLEITLNQHYIHQMTIGRFRLSVTGDEGPLATTELPAEVEAAVLLEPSAWSPEQRRLLEDHFLSTAEELKEQQAQIAKLRNRLPEWPTTMVLQERLPQHQRTTHIHARGEFLNIGEAVEPGVPAVLHDLPKAAPADRLTLARWLVAPENPLVGRVAMNRTWAAFFGQGLVRTPEDFGLQGEPPTHPELLDWLALEFPRQGWSFKRLHRLIVTSATYRQSSHVSDELLRVDPHNRLLARAPRFRVPAEMVRDLALSSAGLLDQKLGGPSVFPPQPDGVTALSYGSLAWTTSTGADRYRRGLYTFAKRTAPYATFVLFDAPTGETCTIRREKSNTPLQALTVLNDAVYMEAAQALARRVLSEIPDGDPSSTVRALFRLCVTRPPALDELEAVAAFAQEQRSRFERGDLQAAPLLGEAAESLDETEKIDRAVWTTVARALLNLDETITRE